MRLAGVSRTTTAKVDRLHAADLQRLNGAFYPLIDEAVRDRVTACLPKTRQRYRLTRRPPARSEASQERLETARGRCSDRGLLSST